VISSQIDASTVVSLSNEKLFNNYTSTKKTGCDAGADTAAFVLSSVEGGVGIAATLSLSQWKAVRNSFSIEGTAIRRSAQTNSEIASGHQSRRYTAFVDWEI
jgi:hypothetical protein